MEHNRLTHLSESLRSGLRTPTELISEVWTNIARCEARKRIFTVEMEADSRKKAEASLLRYRSGKPLSPLDGLPIAIKDNMDVRGYPTSNGLKTTAESASHSAEIVLKLEQLGMIVVGKTNLSEIAFTGLGVNPHYGTPANAVDAAKVPGGSTSGGAVAVALGLVPVALGTDTGGSIRTPAAWNNLYGIKYTQNAFSSRGVTPLSPYLDAIGFLANHLDDLTLVDAALRAGDKAPYSEASDSPPSILVPSHYFFEGMSSDFKEDFDQLTKEMAQQGATVIRQNLPEIDAIARVLGQYGNPVGYEAAANFPALIDDENGLSRAVSDRLASGRAIRDASYQHAIEEIDRIRTRFLAYFDEVSCVLTPTVLSVPPSLTSVQTDLATYQQENARSLHNTRMFNLLNLPTLAMPVPNKSHFSLSISTRPFSETALFLQAKKLEALISQCPITQKPPNE
ncbi:MAG: amidase family protein [Hydrogenovibrio sp.]|uniref:amidase n=1 Tax=Hydrogenovibrio sp. TaxID=2065821 RepID=UPI00287072AA|nr:amidase family protein [Hydrogenovibrio sp.]MDR9497686.1 amidase family protein [Hydrogenovibrio sp.]